MNRLHGSYEVGYDRRNVWLAGIESKRSLELEAVTFISEDRVADLLGGSCVNDVVARAKERGLDEGFFTDSTAWRGTCESGLRPGP